MDFMQEAVKEAYIGIRNGHGGPFGTVIVKEGKIVGRGHNRVVFNKDCTCHGEMEAIRDACKCLDTFDLKNCELYTTAEPCPMCLGAILWSNISKVYYGCNREETEKIGFRDNRFYDYLEKKSDLLKLEINGYEECAKLFKDYSEIREKTYY
ncbi:MAG: nucleoside deaminase [Lachnospiraceae bacterium]|nr:nucleoside deaminase [Lachnospiraceae bacterium]